MSEDRCEVVPPFPSASKKNGPDFAREVGAGLVSEVDGLLWLKILSIAQIVDVLERRRRWRQVRRIQE